MVSFLIGCVSRGWTPRCTYALLWVMLQQLHKLSPSLSLSGSCPPRSWLHIDVITILTFVLFYATVELDEPRRAHCRIHRPVYSAFVAFYFYYNCLLCSRGWGRKMCHNHLWKKKKINPCLRQTTPASESHRPTHSLRRKSCLHLMSLWYTDNKYGVDNESRSCISTSSSVAWEILNCTVTVHFFRESERR